jgi:hypothetical protein
MKTRRLAAIALVAPLLAAGCAFGAKSTVEPPSPSVPTATSRPSPSPDITVEATQINTAVAACSALLDNIPDVRVNSGEPTLGAAYEVTGAQLTNYFVTILDADPNHSNGSDWWDQPQKLVDLCLYDGDFTTTTPGPEGNDTSAARVLVVISHGISEFWARTRDRANLPATDPATMSQ